LFHLRFVSTRRFRELRFSQSDRVSSDGGWADYIVTSMHTLARIPDEIELAAAGP
jgi:D-arabinose 1-dehydrogenase-like Zn-dependent alcohol dehydrogenase